MKIIGASSVILSGSFFIPNDAAIAGGFKDTCNDIGIASLGNDILLIAECAKKDGSEVIVRINLSDLIVNDRGNLAWRRGGRFNDSCSSINAFVLGKSVNLTARCGNGSGGNNFRALINLNSKISNQDGVLSADF